MKSLRVDRSYKELKEIVRLYNSSFPKNERIDFERLIRMLGDDRHMYVYLEDEKIIGMAYFFIFEDIAYLGYICVEEELRNSGYGTAILNRIKEEYQGYRIGIDIEEVKQNSSNSEERVRRRDFYIRNGFVSTDIFYNFFFVDYEILSCGGLIRKEEWQNLVKKHWGRIAKTAKYR